MNTYRYDSSYLDMTLTFEPTSKTPVLLAIKSTHKGSQDLQQSKTHDRQQQRAVSLDEALHMSQTHPFMYMPSMSPVGVSGMRWLLLSKDIHSH